MTYQVMRSTNKMSKSPIHFKHRKNVISLSPPNLTCSSGQFINISPICPSELSTLNVKYFNMTVVIQQCKGYHNERQIGLDRKSKLLSTELKLLLSMHYHYANVSTSYSSKRLNVILGLPCH